MPKNVFSVSSKAAGYQECSKLTKTIILKVAQEFVIFGALLGKLERNLDQIYNKFHLNGWFFLSCVPFFFLFDQDMEES